MSIPHMFRRRHLACAFAVYLAACWGIALPAHASTIPYFNSEVLLHAQTSSGSYTGSITWGGIFTGFDAGVDGASGPGPVTGTASFTNAANGSRSTITDSGSTAGSFGSGALTLGSQSSVNVTNASGLGVGSTYSAQASSAYNDSLDVSALQAGTAYSLDFDFNLAGSTAVSGGGRAYIDVIVNVYDVDAGGGITGDSTWDMRINSNATISTAAADNTGHGALLFRKNSSSDTAFVDFNLVAYSDWQTITNATTVSAESDFLDTLTLTGSSLRDSNGNLIAPALSDTFGNSFGGASGAVPEPSSLVCLASVLALSGVGWIRRFAAGEHPKK